MFKQALANHLKAKAASDHQQSNLTDHKKLQKRVVVYVNVDDFVRRDAWSEKKVSQFIRDHEQTLKIHGDSLPDKGEKMKRIIEQLQQVHSFIVLKKSIQRDGR